MPYFIASSSRHNFLNITGFVVEKGSSPKITIDIRKATPYTSFQAADAAAKKNLA